MTDTTTIDDPESITPKSTSSVSALDYITSQTPVLENKKMGYLHFRDFLHDWPDVDMSDPKVVSDQMAQHANLLNKLSQYLLIREYPDSYPLAFKAQRMMRESLSYIIKKPGPSSEHGDS